MQLARSITVFSNWILSESEPGLDDKKVSLDSRIYVEDYWNDFFYVENDIFGSCKVINNQKYDTWLKD